jgi:hypothetical protein
VISIFASSAEANWQRAMERSVIANFFIVGVL